MTLVTLRFSSEGSPREKLDRKNFLLSSHGEPSLETLRDIQRVGNLTISDVLGELDGIDDGGQQESADCNEKVDPSSLYGILTIESYGQQ